VKLNENVRNIAIIVVLAAAVDGIEQGQYAAATVKEAISLAFLAAFAWIASRLYREHRSALELLGTQRRAILYGAVALAALDLSAYDRLTATGFGTLVWILLLAAAGYAVYGVYRSSKQY
jgi:hypothetical protein